MFLCFCINFLNKTIDQTCNQKSIVSSILIRRECIWTGLVDLVKCNNACKVCWAKSKQQLLSCSKFDLGNISISLRNTVLVSLHPKSKYYGWLRAGWESTWTKREKMVGVSSRARSSRLRSFASILIGWGSGPHHHHCVFPSPLLALPLTML